MTKTIDIVVRSGLEIPLTDMPSELVRKIKKSFEYENPTREKRKRLGFYVDHLATHVTTWYIENGSLIVPRAATQKLSDTLNAFDFDPHFIDDRLEFESIEFIPTERAEPYELFPHQEKIVDAMLPLESCLVRAATGSGKTRAALELIKRAGQPAIIIVWSMALVRQWTDVIVKCLGWNRKDVGIFAGGKKQIAPITVAMQQSLYENVEEAAPHFGTVVCDEIQRLSAKTHSEVISRFPARYRFGFSADERRKDRLEVISHDHLGPIACEVPWTDLIDDGFLCDVEIVVHPTDVRYPKLDRVPARERGKLIGRDYKKIIDLLESDEGRTRMIAELAAKEAKDGRFVLVFSDRVGLCQDLSKRISLEHNVNCGLFLGGPGNKRQFDETKEALDSGRLSVGIGTSCIYQGVDIPRLDSGIVATPTASNRALLEQQIGRLRRRFPGKKRGILNYIWDAGIFPNHLELLKRYYGKRVTVAGE